MFSRTRLTDKTIGDVVDIVGQGLITIDDFDQLNEKSVEGICRVIRRPVGTTGGVSNPGVAVSEMAEANLQRMIYYINHFKRIGRTCAHMLMLISPRSAQCTTSGT